MTGFNTQTDNRCMTAAMKQINQRQAKIKDRKDPLSYRQKAGKGNIFSLFR